MELTEGWEVAPTPPGQITEPSGLDGLDGLDWRPARVPGTAASAMASAAAVGAAGAAGYDFDTEDWWFRCRFAAGADRLAAPALLQLGGIATVGEVFLNRDLVFAFESMWQAHEIDVSGRLRRENELVIACRALAPLLVRRRRPGARWRTRVVNHGNLRWYRTMVYGRSPGFAPGPAAVGPWRPVSLVRADLPGLSSLDVRTRLDGADGVVLARVRPRGDWARADLRIGERRVPLRPDSGGVWAAELRIAGAERWWPHTHGSPVLHELTVELDGAPVAVRRVGFRSLEWAADIPQDGLDLRVNDCPVFARGAVWTPPDLISLAPPAGQLRALLEQVTDAGMNMLRVVGTGAYESATFHDLCDELGILVWQDLMFANLDYPADDPVFRAGVEREARQVLTELAGRPSLAVLCGNSEVEQQPAMMGLDPTLGRGQLWDSGLPALVAESGADCAYVRSTPCGGPLPFFPGQGVTHYFGVSGFFGALGDARRAEVRFASECLALANVPDEVGAVVHHPVAKAGVQRDAGTGWDLGAGWDFDDVRDHYLAQLFGIDAVELRRFDHARYLELSRAVSGEVMAEVMGEWRRARSPCRGALVLWLKDMLPGSGLGILDAGGRPKVAYHHLRRALRPVAVWTTDEGVAGIAVHIANDRGRPLSARLRIALYRDLETRVDETVRELELAEHSSLELNLEGVLGRFVDATWAYRFGPPAQDVVVATLEDRDGEGEPLSQAFRFPAGRPIRPQPANALGLEGTVAQRGCGQAVLVLRSRRLAYGVRLQAPGFTAADDAFSLEPGHPRRVRLSAGDPAAEFAGGSLTALNLQGELRIGAGP